MQCNQCSVTCLLCGLLLSIAVVCMGGVWVAVLLVRVHRVLIHTQGGAPPRTSCQRVGEANPKFPPAAFSPLSSPDVPPRYPTQKPALARTRWNK